MGKKKTAYVNKNKKEKKELKELAYEKKKKRNEALSTSHPYVQCIKAPYRKTQRTSSSRHSHLAQTETGKKQIDEKKKRCQLLHKKQRRKVRLPDHTGTMTGGQQKLPNIISYVKKKTVSSHLR